MSDTNSDMEQEVVSDDDHKTADDNDVVVAAPRTHSVNEEVPLPRNDSSNDHSQDGSHDNTEDMEDIPVDKTETNDSAVVSENVVVNKNVDISERVQNFKNWGINAFMKTKQKVKERLKKTSRTVDSNLEDKIEVLRGKKTQYGLMVNNNLRTIEQLRQMILVHQYSARMNAEMSQTELVLTDNFLKQTQIETNKTVLIKDLINKLACSNETLETLVNKTFDDIMSTIQSYENARIEFDAYKTETVNLVTQLQQKGSAGVNNHDQTRLQEMQESLEQRRQRYELIKDNLLIKIDLLEDHKNHVIQRELLNCRHVWFNFYSQCADLYTEPRTAVTESKEVDS